MKERRSESIEELQKKYPGIFEDGNKKLEEQGISSLIIPASEQLSGGGQAIVIGIGLALSTGFFLMEKTMNFSLKSFGMLAVARACLKFYVWLMLTPSFSRT